MHRTRRVRDPDDPRGKAAAAGIGVALSILSLGLLAWMALDVDGDGYSSYAEVREGTAPMNGDTDGDGVADGWELDHGYDALSMASVPSGSGQAVPSTPTDGDGDIQNCPVGDISLSGCTADEAAAEAPNGDGDASGAEELPTGRSGVGITSALGVTTTVLAGVAGRVIAVRILHS